MSTITQTTTADFVTEHHITMLSERVSNNPNMGGDSRNMDHWKVRLMMGRKRLTTYFSMGIGHEGKAPTAADVLDCLASDATVENVDFEEWCGDMGYDSDSRKAKRTYDITTKQTNKLKAFLGDDAFDVLVYHTDRM